MGHGSGDASHLLGNYGAAQARAANAATYDAQVKARLMLGLVHCPRCGKRDAVTTRQFLLGVIGKCVLIGGLAAAMAFFILHSASGVTMLIGAMIAAALSIALYFWAVGALDPLKQASLCVKFLDGVPSA